MFIFFLVFPKKSKVLILHLSSVPQDWSDTTKLTVKEVKTIVWKYTFAYYNTKRVTTVNPGGLPPAVYRERTASVKNAA